MGAPASPRRCASVKAAVAAFSCAIENAHRQLHGSLPDEARIDADQAAEPFVLADIATVRPKLIVALGKSAASLFGASTAINSARREVFWFQHIPVRIKFAPCVGLGEATAHVVMLQ